ncbi:unnamed protein product, partial [Mesorhabditis spiculigera]
MLGVASIYLLIRVLALEMWTCGLDALNSTDSSACGQTEQACPGKDGQPICVPKDTVLNATATSCQTKGCLAGRGEVFAGKDSFCVPFDMLGKEHLPDSWTFAGCQVPGLMDCGTRDVPLCVPPTAILKYDSETRICTLSACNEEPSNYPCKQPNGDSLCTFFSHIKTLHDNGTCEPSAESEVCPPAHVNCGKYDPICIPMYTPRFRAADLRYFNDRTRECQDERCPIGHHPCSIREKGDKKICMPYWHIKSVGDHDSCQLVNPNELPNLKPAKECAGLKNTLACWAANDDYTCIGFERINSMIVDKQNKTICTFAKCTGEDALLCSAECQSIHEVKRVLPGGECEFRTLRRGQIIMIISCSIIGTVGAIAVAALLTRAIILQKNRNKPIEHRPCSMENKHQDGDSNEKRPFLPSKNPKAFNEKPQV